MKRHGAVTQSKGIIKMKRHGAVISEIGMGESQKVGKWGLGREGGGGALCGPRWGPGALPLMAVMRRSPLKLKAFSY